MSRELAKEPTPEPEETEEERIQRELGETEDSVKELQAAIRGMMTRERIMWTRARLERCEKGVVQLQSVIRGQMVRNLFKDHLQNYRATVDWATLVSTIEISVNCRSKLLYEVFSSVRPFKRSSVDFAVTKVLSSPCNPESVVITSAKPSPNDKTSSVNSQTIS